MAKFHWVTTWRLKAPQQAVWDAVYDTANWPRWWRFVAEAREIKRGDESGVGSVWRYVWRTRLWYKIRFDMTTTEIEPPSRLNGRASGKVAGHGGWSFSSDGDVTSVTYVWDIETKVWWMNLFAPLLRPFFNWNHDQVMRAGGEGLARHLGATLVE